MRDRRNESELTGHFRAQARTARARAPLNAALCGVIADRPELSEILQHAPPTQRLPVLLLAAIHATLLDEPLDALAAWYPNLTADHRAPDDSDLAVVLPTFIEAHRSSITELVATRAVQTNEVGRCALFLPGFEAAEREMGPLSHLDIGASAGLTTLLGRYAYRYDDEAQIGSSKVVIECSTRGDRPAPTRLPTIAAARGLDLSPVDPSDPEDARWLLACCWPDQHDRFDRLAGALTIAEHHPPVVHAGDAVLDLARMVEMAVSDNAHPVITTSWALNYLDSIAQADFVHEIDQIGASCDLTWLIAESPAQTPALDHADALRDEHITALVNVSWRDGRRSVEHVGTAHPHGYWIHWSEQD